MSVPVRTLLAVASAAAVLAACGGMRYGLTSAALGSDGTAVVSGPPAAPASVVKVPGATLHLQFNTMLQTFEFAVILFVVPVSIDPFDRFHDDTSRGLRLSLRIEPEYALRFEPAQVRLELEGVIHAPVESTQLLPTPPDYGVRTVLAGGTGPSHLLPPGGRGHGFVLHFDLPVPRPETAMRLQLNEALRPQDARLQAPIPPILFGPAPWKYGYT